MRFIDKAKFPNHFRTRFGLFHIMGPLKRRLVPLTDRETGEQYYAAVDQVAQKLVRIPV